ncbi:phage tail protein I [Roseinatronobacter sp.]
MTINSLLPRGATRLERALEETMARGTELPVPLRDIAAPETAPDAFVPWLAWGLSTDLWDRDWPIEKKRAVAQAWYRLHRLKGTQAGIEEAIRFFGGNVVGVRRPPDAFYPDPSLTRAERDKYLARFQQLRFFRFRNRGAATFGAYVGSGLRRSGLFAGAGFHPTFTDAPVRIGRRAFLFDPLTGIETPVKRADRVTVTDRRGATDFEEVSLPGSAGRSFFAGRLRPGKLFTSATGARARTYSVAIDREYTEQRSKLHISGVIPATQPIDVRPRRVRLPGERVRGQLFPARKSKGTAFIGRAGDGPNRVFLPRSSAENRIFDQVFLFDRDRLPDKRDARTFVGHTRLGMTPYHARVTVELRGKLSPFAFQRFVTGHLIGTSKKRLRQVVEATRLSKSLRDKVWITAKTVRPAKAGDSLRIGTIKVGALLRDI